jgi:two-component system response regulator AdeR
MPKIAIIEDEAAIAEMYRIKLVAEGFNAKIAVNGQAGLELCEKFKPDLVLLDLMMPLMSGPQMLKKLRAKPWGKNLPVIIISNLGIERSDVDLDKYKVSAYIVKALSTPSQIVEEVKRSLRETA